MPLCRNGMIFGHWQMGPICQANCKQHSPIILDHFLINLIAFFTFLNKNWRARARKVRKLKHEKGQKFIDDEDEGEGIVLLWGGGNYSGKSRIDLIEITDQIRLASLSALPCAFHRGTFLVGGTLRAERKRAIGFQFEFGATRLLFVFVLLSLHAAQHIGVQTADFQRGDQAAMGEAEAPHIQQRAQKPLAAQKAEMMLKE